MAAPQLIVAERGPRPLMRYAECEKFPSPREAGLRSNRWRVPRCE
jgi:hypothetical protein